MTAASSRAISSSPSTAMPVAGIDDLLRLLNHERVGRETRVTLLRRGELRERFIVPVERR